MTFSGHASPNSPMPGSPPDLTGSKSSKSSSFHSSYLSDDNSILSDVGNFEDIGLDDESRAEAEIGDFEVKTSSNPYDATYNADLRSAAKQRKRIPMSTTHGNRNQRELTSGKTRPAFPSLRGQVRSATTDGLGLLPIHNGTAPRRFTTNAQSLPIAKRNRSTSPNIPRSPSYNSALKTRRGSWQANRERKTALELEKECDEEDGDDVPDECFLENVPISPRPPQERTKSMPPSASTSPERPPKEKVRSVGNGTSPRPAEQGELRSPRAGMNRNASMGQFPINHDNFPKGRAKSWTDALSELSPEAKALTEALEAHAEDEEQKVVDPRLRRSFSKSNRPATVEKQRVRSAIAELPPLRRTDIMIDPLPISKEKEAVLSRTRPSWLPPKNPAEEKKHLKEYQKMMASAIEAEKKREADRRAKTTCRDDTANSLLRIWEEHVLPNWDEATRQKRTRELWWRGIAPRSRGAVWAKAIGNELGLSDSSYTAALRRAQALERTIASGSQLSGEEQKKKASLDRIAKDAETTYPELRIFQPDGPLHRSLVDVLKAYAMYRSDVGYVPGTSTIAALLLLNLPSPSASFCALSNILNRPLPLSFHTSDSGATSRAYSLLLSTLQARSPQLHKHLASMNLNPEIYLRDIFTSLMTGCLSLDNASRLWDVMVFEGDAVVVRAGVAWLTNMEGKLFGAESPKAVYDIVRKGLDNMEEESWITSVRAAGKQ
ncbi:uncharacterized protein LY89DRAFT_575086 [Mollisia scopiformis]|uniref:Rab-GAP TBC domain-containing protein n=1 Tax=Mollisia scopiformis TaxID=149040 RepID=A0A194XT91_MOLSC|nr:uncharacterized protein LY89DRAFT_575086 [Mollisia scopiformis]KUJ22917.1 hypothetical protein LY89DRAFT_575086 [Mollisia scopiformis]